MALQEVAAFAPASSSAALKNKLTSSNDDKCTSSSLNMNYGYGGGGMMYRGNGGYNDYYNTQSEVDGKFSSPEWEFQRRNAQRAAPM